MALAALSGDEAGIVFVQLCNALEPRLAVYLSSASTWLRAATQVLRRQLRADHEAATALCLKMGMRSCKELREAKKVVWVDRYLSAAELTTLGTLGAVLPALEHLEFRFESTFPDSVERLTEGLGAGALPAVTWLQIKGEHAIDAGASVLAAALGRGAMPRLKNLFLTNTAIGDAGLVALAPALRRLPALEQLCFIGSPLGDEGLAALVETPPCRAHAVLKKLQVLDFSHTEITDAGCAALASALDSGVLPALVTIDVNDTPTSAAGKAAVTAALATSKWRAFVKQREYDEYGEYGYYHRCGRGCGCCGGTEEDEHGDELEGELDAGGGAGWSSVMSISGAAFDLSKLEVTAAQARKIAPLLCANAELRAIRCAGGELRVSDLRGQEELEWDAEEIHDVEAIIIAP